MDSFFVDEVLLNSTMMSNGKKYESSCRITNLLPVGAEYKVEHGREEAEGGSYYGAVMLGDRVVAEEHGIRQGATSKPSA